MDVQREFSRQRPTPPETKGDKPAKGMAYPCYRHRRVPISCAPLRPVAVAARGTGYAEEARNEASRRLLQEVFYTVLVQSSLTLSLRE